jgi:hypothetical protein
MATRTASDIVLSPFDELERAHVPGARPRVNWATQYAVYFSNLSQHDLGDLHQLFFAEPRYCGYVDVSYGGPARDYLADTLAHEMLICDKKALLVHDGDEPIDNKDPMLYGLEDFGFDVVSFLGEYFNTFFSYKIEIGDTPGADIDRALNLAASVNVATPCVFDQNMVDFVVCSPDAEARLLFGRSARMPGSRSRRVPCFAPSATGQVEC